MSTPEVLASVPEGAAKALVKAPGDALIELFTGGNPIAAIQNNTREGVKDILYAPFRIARNVGVGALKGAARLTWNTIKNLPIWPVWNAERNQVKTGTNKQLEELKTDTFELPGTVV